MAVIDILAQWTLRSAILILTGALILSALRLKDPSIRLAAWIAMLFGSLAIPAMTLAPPAFTWTAAQTQVQVPPAGAEVATGTAESGNAATTAIAGSESGESGGVGDLVARHPLDWRRAALILYTLVALTFLARIAIGLAMTTRLRRRSSPTQAIGIQESTHISAPVTLGIINPVIVLPIDWRDWEPAKLQAVLAHERSHIRRHDPAVQLLSAIHRALLWHSPLSWFLHSRIVRVAEEASDDAAVAATQDRATYAEWLLEFMQRGVCNAGVPMARYGSVDRRIHRILTATAPSRGLTRFAVIAVLALGAPMAYVIATAQLRSATGSHPAPAQPTATPQSASQPVAPAKPVRTPGVIYGLGNVTATTVTVRPNRDGQLISVEFKEGEFVEAGKLMARMDPRKYEAQLREATTRLVNDRMAAVRANEDPKQLVKSDQDLIDDASRGLEAADIKAPISGIAGLRMVDPGNTVRTTDAIVTIARIQPIAVVFTIPEDSLPRVRKRLIADAHPIVEAWSRDNKTRFASGVLTATDNQIDRETGTIKLKASFDNKDGALFPNQFVNVRLLLNPQ